MRHFSPRVWLFVFLAAFVLSGEAAMLSGDGKNAPAPWVPFTRAGCDVGVFSSANIAIETPSFDVPFIFGPNSPEAQETPDQQFNDFEGAAIHCAKGSPVCSSANHGVADVLPQEPGG
jgi:hypothetical protein